ncbi:dienelactone hydrolase family protein [Corallococcus llansteffanensis]|uniref:Dienelactone hydrolase family protein n=1 Tax=Corallococcus llansteffanensis TaxID=2316731 RepID=A0A3A8PWU4_9BACT|nr:dienelactone hydrolase family protein [Corallococcus llansteffanensis]RKH60906.1 dienelactone hydrolase family protein [Corallococcus llansteffanensis]
MASSSSTRVHAEYVDYADGETVCQGYAAHDTAHEARRPCVLIAHAWDGQNTIMRSMAEGYAEQGYVGFALDVYGKGVRGEVMGDNSHLMGPFLEDRALLRRRMLAGLEAARRHPRVDSTRIAVLGYCFGGLCALDLARSAPEGLKGAVSIHGVLQPPRLGPQPPITASVLLLHGWEDPVARPDAVLAIARELTDAGADWQLQAYGHAMHAFTFEGATPPQAGILYNALAARRAAAALGTFLAQILGDTTPGP